MKKNIFCSSPWLHLKITLRGWYVPCRWMTLRNVNLIHSIDKMTLQEYFNSDQMRQLRLDLLNDKKSVACESCYYEDSFNKMSGRKIQLSKSNIADDTFCSDVVNSPHREMFEYSAANSGETNLHPVDLQVNLSDVCNGACIMCSPQLSTRLMQDYKKLPDTTPIIYSLTTTTTPWVNNPILLNQFIKDLHDLPNIEYLHLLGGETLYLESFYKICNALADSGRSKSISIGTTTNLTVDPNSLEPFIANFKNFHIGLSIESANTLNDYIRYPATIDTVKSNFLKFIELRKRLPNLHLSLRITPNIFSIFCLDEIIQLMCDNDIIAESCDILSSPPFLRMELLPDDLRQIAINKLRAVIEKNNLINEPVVVSQTRNQAHSRPFIADAAHSYLNFLTNMVPPDDVEKSRSDLIAFIKGFESIRQNSILDHLPEYKNFLNRYGY